MEELKTFKEWKSLGYRIHKGSKCEGFLDGEPLFSKDQVYYVEVYNNDTTCHVDTSDYDSEDLDINAGHGIKW